MEYVPNMIEVGNSETSKLERTEMFSLSPSALVTRNAATGTSVPHISGTKNKCPQKKSMLNMRARITLKAARKLIPLTQLYACTRIFSGPNGIPPRMTLSYTSRVFPTTICCAPK